MTLLRLWSERSFQRKVTPRWSTAKIRPSLGGASDVAQHECRGAGTGGLIWTPQSLTTAGSACQPRVQTVAHADGTLLQAGYEGNRLANAHNLPRTLVGGPGTRKCRAR
jgi:hypothetical protein